MWTQAGFPPDAFWQQTPLHYQLAMKGVRARRLAEYEDRTRQAWETGAFTGATQSKGGLKPLRHYLRKPERRQSPGEMLAAFHALRANGAKMSIKRVKLSPEQDATANK